MGRVWRKALQNHQKPEPADIYEHDVSDSGVRAYKSDVALRFALRNAVSHGRDGKICVIVQKNAGRGSTLSEMVIYFIVFPGMKAT
jgi:hypothetical protein